MNERFKALAEQARTHWAENKQTDKNRQEPGVYYHIDVVDKFAQLIVQECVSQLEWQKLSPKAVGPYNSALSLAQRNLKEHFGVEK